MLDRRKMKFMLSVIRTAQNYGVIVTGYWGKYSRRWYTCSLTEPLPTGRFHSDLT